MFYLSGWFSMYFSVQGRQFNFQLTWKMKTNLNCTHNIQHIIDTVWCFSLWWVEEDAWVRTFKICWTLWTHCCASQQVKQDCIEQTGNDFLAVGIIVFMYDVKRWSLIILSFIIFIMTKECLWYIFFNVASMVNFQFGGWIHVCRFYVSILSCWPMAMKWHWFTQNQRKHFHWITIIMKIYLVIKSSLF